MATAVIPRPGIRRKRAAAFAFATAVFVLALGLATGHSRPTMVLAGVLCIGSIAAAGPVVRWRSVHVTILLIILFIPIGEYFLPGNLPFQLEPYRLVLGIVIALWVASLLVDPAVKVKATGYEGPIYVLVLVTLASVAANPSNVHAVQSDVVKSLIFFLSFLAFYYLVSSTLHSWPDIDLIIKIIVGGASVLGLLALIEYRTGFTPFNDLDRIIPLRRVPFAPQPRGGHIRAQGSAEHPIAFGALMVMTMPLCIYLIRKYRGYWVLAPFLLALGALSSVSRTAVVMILGGAAVILWLHPRDTILFLRRPRTLAAIAIILVGIKVIAPGAVGTLRYEFNPPGGLAADQSTSKGSAVSGGRLTDLGPVLSQVSTDPLLGVGYGTQVTGRTNSGGYAQGRILDDQWLGILWETGFLGVLGWVWWLGRYLRRIAAASRDASGDLRWLLVGLASGVAAFALGMFTYDAYSFIQETFMLFVFLALGAIIMRSMPRDGAEKQVNRAPRHRRSVHPSP